MAITVLSLSSILNFSRANTVSGPKPSGTPGIPWAEISGGIQTTATIDGIDYQIHTFTSNGTLTVSKEGYIDCLVVGGGASAKNQNSRSSGGGGGGVRYGLVFASVGTEAITIGSGGSGVSTNTSQPGSSSILGSIILAGGGGWCVAFPSANDTSNRQGRDGQGGGGSQGGTFISNVGGNRSGGGAWGVPSSFSGVVLNYDGTSKEYGRGGDVSNTTPAANQGWGAPSGTNGTPPGSNGVVIVRVPV